MANEGEGLGKTPKALSGRQREVLLSDGTSVTVTKWSWSKFMTLVPLVGLLANALKIATESVLPSERERVATLDGEDVLAISIAAQELNLPPGTMGNLKTLLQIQARVEEAAEKKRAPSSQA